MMQGMTVECGGVKKGGYMNQVLCGDECKLQCCIEISEKMENALLRGVYVRWLDDAGKGGPAEPDLPMALTDFFKFFIFQKRKRSPRRGQNATETLQKRLPLWRAAFTELLSVQSFGKTLLTRSPQPPTCLHRRPALLSLSPPVLDDNGQPTGITCQPRIAF